MTTPPDFGGRDLEEGVTEALGGPQEVFPMEHLDVDPSSWESNEATAPGKVCARCGQAIEEHQESRRRLDGHWVHEVCP
jgi:hypothetical protein